MKSKAHSYRTIFCLMLLSLVACTTEQQNSSPLVTNQSSQSDQGLESSNTVSPTGLPAGQTTNNIVQLDSSTVNKVPPAGILQEVSFYGGGGSGVPSCGDAGLQIYENISLEPGCRIDAWACGFQTNENTDVTIAYPDGTNKSFQAQPEIITGILSDQYSIIKIQQDLSVDDPAGIYKIIVQSQSGKVEKDINVNRPAAASAYRYPDRLLLQNFQPDEQVRLFIYQGGSSGGGLKQLKGWSVFKADDNGRAKISYDPTAFANQNFVLLGDVSGQVLVKDPEFCSVILHIDGSISADNSSTNNSTSSNPSSCGGMQSRLSAGKSARVAFTDGNDMRIRSDPGLSQGIVTKIPEGTQFTTLEGPQCVDGISWWKIRTNDGSEGWAAEYSDGVYLLEPYP